MVTIWQVVLIGFVTMAKADLLDPAAPAKDASAPLKTVYSKCVYSRAHGMYGVDCSGRDLIELPRNLKSNIEILDVSYNRIRHIDSVATYSKLKFLYLGDNFIVNLEPGTVDRLEYLEALDLSVNAMQHLPAFIFNINSLRRLYLSNNSFRHNFLEDVQLPIKAPLEFIDLSFSEMQEMPFFGSMPDLYHLNISGNPFYKITVDHITPLCRLGLLDVTKIGRNHIDGCECYKLQKYLLEQQIKVLPEVRAICNYQLDVVMNCPKSLLNETDLTLHNECLSKIHIRQKQEQAKTTWTGVVIGITSFLIAFIAILYIIHVKNVRHMELEEMRHRKNEANHNLVKN